MDRYEGEPDHYVRLGYPFYDAKARYTHLGHLYVARPERLVQGKMPTDGYLDHIRAGYEENGFEMPLGE